MSEIDVTAENNSYRESIVMEMLSYYSPTPAGEAADLELTSAELAERFSEIIEMKPDQISILMAKAGFHLALRGNKFFWQLDNI